VCSRPKAFTCVHAIALYAGAEAAKRAGFRHWRAGADTDYREAAYRINDITADEKCIDLMFKLAKRRAVLAVEHYWPEIEAVAKALLKSRTLTGEQVQRIVSDSQMARRSGGPRW
jgi:hypothetical protein